MGKPESGDGTTEPRASRNEPLRSTTVETGERRLARGSVSVQIPAEQDVIELLSKLETEAKATRTSTEEALVALLHARDNVSRDELLRQWLADDARKKEMRAREALQNEALAWKHLAEAARLYATKYPNKQPIMTTAEIASTNETAANQKLAKGFRPMFPRQSTEPRMPKKDLDIEPGWTADVGERGEVAGFSSNSETRAPDLEVGEENLEARDDFWHQPLIFLTVLLLVLVLVASAYLLPPDATSGEAIAVKALEAAIPLVVGGAILTGAGVFLQRGRRSPW